MAGKTPQKKSTKTQRSSKTTGRSIGKTAPVNKKDTVRKASGTKNEPKMKRNHKDTVFTDLFTDPKYLIQMYRVLHPEDKRAGIKDLSDITIHKAMTDSIYNDLGFSVRGSVVLLVEAQSTWTVNIILRILMYLVDTYNEQFKRDSVDLYSSKKAKIPKPELYVIYTGKRGNKPDFITFNDEFFGGKITDVDVKVHVIYDEDKDDIIRQYIAYTRVADEQIEKLGRTREAVKEIIRICKDRNILADYMTEREVEVMDIMTTLFDQDEVTRRYLVNRDRDIAEKAEKKKEADDISKMADYFQKQDPKLSRAAAVKMAKGILK